MTESKIVKVKDLLGEVQTLDRTQGIKLWDAIKTDLLNKNKISLDFSGIDLIIGSFFNPLVSNIFNHFNENEAAEIFQNFINLSDIDKHLLKKTVSRIGTKLSENIKKHIDEAIDNDQ